MVVWSQVGIAIIIALGEGPVETLRRLFGQPAGNRSDFNMVRRIGEPARDAQGILQEVDHRRSVLVDEGLPRAPHQKLRHSANVAIDE